MDNLPKDHPLYVFEDKKQTQKRILYYVLLAIISSLIFPLIGVIPLHTVYLLRPNLEIIASSLALLIGILSLMNFLSRKNYVFLIIGLGFLSAAVLDGYRAITSNFSNWDISMVSLSFFMLLSLVPKSRKNFIYWAISACLLLVLFVFWLIFPINFVVLSFYLLVLVAYLKKGTWKIDYFEHFLIFFIIVNIVGHLQLLAFSFNLIYPLINMSLLKIFGSSLVLVGLLINMYHLFIQAEKGKELLTTHILSLSHARDKTEEALLEMRKFKQTVESSNDGIIITTPSSRIVYVNQAWQQMTGFTIEDVINRNPREFHSAKTPVRIYQKMQNSLSSGNSFITEEIILKQKKGGQFPVQISIFPIIENKQALFYVWFEQDISKRKEVDRMKTDFLSVAAHQLRTPLGSMRWNMEMLLSGDMGQLPVTAAQSIKQNYENVIRLINLVNDLLNVSQIDQGRVQEEPEQVDIIEIVKSLVKEQEFEARSHSVTIEFKQTSDHLPKIIIDPKHLRTVFQNLISNAIKYNRPGGKVTITIRKVDHQVQISLEDSGIGIPKKDQERVFSKFFRAQNAIKSETEGTGLGLFVVKSYIESWGGKVWFESEVGIGTTITVVLPLKPKRHSLDKNLQARNQ